MFTKFRDSFGEKKPYKLNFTQPNMAFTPRQIIEQFSSGEVVARENTPSDEFYDDKYSDDELASIVQIDDDFQARQAVIDFQIEQKLNDTETSTNFSTGAEAAAAPPAEPVSSGDGSSDSLDTSTSNL